MLEVTVADHLGCLVETEQRYVGAVWAADQWRLCAQESKGQCDREVGRAEMLGRVMEAELDRSAVLNEETRHRLQELETWRAQMPTLDIAAIEVRLSTRMEGECPQGLGRDVLNRWYRERGMAACTP